MEGNGMVATQSQQTGQQQFKCTGDCMKCLPVQRAYCASQHAYSNMRVLDKLMEIVMNLQKEVIGIAAKVEAMQNNEALLFDPNLAGETSEHSITQEGSGVIE